MVMTIDVPEKIVRDAEASGISVEEQLQRLAQRQREPDLSGLIPIGRQHSSPEEAAAARRKAGERMREIASRNTLGGISIKELINEGRKY